MAFERGSGRFILGGRLPVGFVILILLGCGVVLDAEDTLQRAGPVEIRPRGPNGVVMPSEVEFGDFFALIIAPASYQPGWPELPSPVAEARVLEDLLRGSFGFNEIDVRTKPSETTQSAISRALDELPARENILVFFSGHGMEDDRGLTYWVPSDGHTGDYLTWVSHELVRSRVKWSIEQDATRHVLIISDSCFAGGLFRSRRNKSEIDPREWPSWVVKEYSRPSVQILVSGGVHPVVGDTACESSHGRLGVFFCALREALTSSRREVWTARELEQELGALMVGVELPDGKPQVPGIGDLDIPHVGSGEFLFVKRDGPTAGRATAKLGELEFTVSPAGARVFVDNKEIEIPALGGRMEVLVHPGIHEIRVELEGYETQVVEAEVVIGQTTPVELSLASVAIRKPLPGVSGSGRGIVYVRSEPPGAEILVDGQSTGKMTPAQIEEVPAGSRELTLRFSKYHDWVGQIEVPEDNVRWVQTELMPAFGELIISSEPAGALVYLDDRQVGVTDWRRRELESGRYRVRLAMRCFEDVEAEVAVQDGKTTEHYLLMQPSCGALSIRTDPPGAQIEMDGADFGLAPVEIGELSVGTHEIRASLELHKPTREVVGIPPGSRREVVLELQPNYGTVVIEPESRIKDGSISTPVRNASVATTDGANLMPDRSGAFVGRFPPGHLQILVKAEGYRDESVTVESIVGEGATYAVELTRLVGHLTVLTEPPEAEVWLDGELVGRSPITLRDVPTGEYRLVAKKNEDVAEKTVLVEAQTTRTERLGLAAALPEPGDLWVDPGIGMRFRYIPAGEFMMGSPEGEPGRYDHEIQHHVTITRGYWMGETEVTQGQWKALMGSNPSEFTSCGDECPVETVNWWEATAYANAVSRKAGMQGCYRLSGCEKRPGEDMECDSASFVGLSCEGYRLPTEAEWEYAARAGGSHQYSGSNDIDSVGWYGDNSRKKTHRVGKKQANPWGLRDMSGNVWEWCYDWRGDYPRGSVTDPTGPSLGSGRVERGGSWDDYARYCRSALRYRFAPGFRNNNLGFRLVRTVP